MTTTLDYASSPDFRAAVSRAQWAVVQTGLITSGLALFGVYVLATRINDMHLMSMYATDWIPAGPLLVGLIAGSGYILASWWFGVRVGAKLIAAILLLQLAMFMACHYADFETLDLVYRDTGQPVGFVRFFHYTTARLGSTELDPWVEPPPVRGYLIRGAEAACFAAGGLLAALTLVGRPKCGLCGGLVRRRRLGKVGGPRVGDTLKRLEERARLRDARGFYKEMTAGSDGVAAVSDDAAIELVMHRCDVCGVGAVEQVEHAASPTSSPPSSTSSQPRRPHFHVDVHDDFARELFETRQAPA